MRRWKAALLLCVLATSVAIANEPDIGRQMYLRLLMLVDMCDDGVALRSAYVDALTAEAEAAEEFRIVNDAAVWAWGEYEQAQAEYESHIAGCSGCGECRVYDDRARCAHSYALNCANAADQARDSLHDASNYVSTCWAAMFQHTLECDDCDS